MNTPPIVSADEWTAARAALLVKEKEMLRARDANTSDVSRAWRWAGCATWSATIEQPTHAWSGQPCTPGSRNARYTMSCVRPSNKSTKLFSPSGVSNR